MSLHTDQQTQTPISIVPEASSADTTPAPYKFEIPQLPIDAFTFPPSVTPYAGVNPAVWTLPVSNEPVVPLPTNESIFSSRAPTGFSETFSKVKRPVPGKPVETRSVLRRKPLPAGSTSDSEEKTASAKRRERKARAAMTKVVFGDQAAKRIRLDAPPSPKGKIDSILKKPKEEVPVVERKDKVIPIPRPVRDMSVPPPLPPRPGAGTSIVVPPAARYTTIAEYFRSAFLYKIGFNDTLVRKFCDERGIKVEQCDRSPHDHPLTAACRFMAMKAFLEIVGAKKTKLKVLSWFGANRDLQFKVPRNLELNWVLGPDVAVAGDLAREMNQRQPVTDDYDDFVICDVYQSGFNADQALTPATIIPLLQASRSKVGYIIARKFFGAVGGDVIKVDNRNYVEGTWFRDFNNQIVFRSDDNSIAYSPHPDIDWLFSGRTCDGIDISVVNTFGPYSLLRVAITDPHAIPIGIAPKIVPTIELRTIRGDLSWWSEKIHRYLPRSVANFFCSAGQPHYVHNVIVGLYKTRYSIKSVTGLGLDALHDRIIELAKTDELLVKISERYPEIYANILKGTMVAIFFDDRVDNINNMLALRKNAASAEVSLAQLRSQNLEPGSSRSGLFVKFIGACVAILVALRAVLKIKTFWSILRPASASAFTFQHFSDIIVSPILEETLKSYFPLAAIPIAVMDIFRYYYEQAIKVKQMTTGELVVFALVFGMRCWFQFNLHATFHIIGEKEGLVTAMTCHAAYNTLVYLSPSLAWAATALAPCLAVPATHSPNGPLVYEALIGLVRQHFFKASSVGAIWKMFTDVYYDGQDLEHPDFILPLPSNAPSTTAILPVQSLAWPLVAARGNIEVFQDGFPVNMLNFRHLISGEPPDAHRMFPIVMSTAILYTPANTINNTIASVMYRTHKDPFANCPPVQERKQCWGELYHCEAWQQLLGDWAAHIDSVKLLDMIEACAEMGKRGRRIWETYEQMVRGCITNPKKSYAVKWDETIPFKEVLVGGQVVRDLRPRAICKLDPHYHVETVAWSRLLAESLHLICNVDDPIIRNECVMCFCSGYTNDRLSRLFTLFQHYENVICVAGDDSICKFTVSPGRVIYVEADFSMCDQSQDECPLNNFLRSWMTKLLVQQAPIYSYQDSFSKNYTISSQKFDIRIRGRAGWQLCTGSTATTVVNSVNNLALWIHVLNKRKTIWQKDTAEVITNYALQLGFTVKVKTFEDPSNLTFLKGWFVPTLDPALPVVWMPLPSAVIKIGKIMKNPLKFFSSYEQIAFMIYQSYRHVPPDLPILGPFFTMFLRLAGSVSVSAESEVIENYEFKPKVVSAVPINVPLARQMILYRYGLVEVDILAIEKIYDSISTLPVLYHCPHLFKLRDVDYA